MRARTSTRRTLVWILCVVAFAVAATYALGGTAAFSRMRARVRAFLEPPTAREMQNAVAAAQQAAGDSTLRADTASRRQDRPASPGWMLSVIALAIGATFVLLIVSTRWAARRSESS